MPDGTVASVQPTPYIAIASGTCAACDHRVTNERVVVFGDTQRHVLELRHLDEPTYLRLRNALALSSTSSVTTHDTHAGWLR